MSYDEKGHFVDYCSVDDIVTSPLKEKLFCSACGSKLKKDGRLLRYDEYTGQPIYADGSNVCHNPNCKNSPFWKGKERV